MYIYDEFYKKNKKLMDAAEKELNNTVRYLNVTYDCEKNFQSAFDNSLNVIRLKKEFDIEISVQQSKHASSKGQSAMPDYSIFVFLKKKFENSELKFNYCLKINDTLHNRLDLVTVNLRKNDDVRISLSNTTFEMYLRDYPFVFQKHKAEGRIFEFGLRGRQVEDYIKVIEYYKNNTDIQDKDKQFFQALKFMTQLYTSEVFYINKEFTCDVLLSKLYNKNSENVYNKYPTIKHELELKELSEDKKFDFIDSQVELLNILTPSKKKPKIELK